MKISLEALKPYYSIRELKTKDTLLFITTHKYNVFRSIPSSLNNDASSEETFQSLISPSSEKTMPTHDYWNKITDGLYLGKLPEMVLTNPPVDQAAEIKKYIRTHDPKRPLKLVVSVLDYFELAGVGLTASRPILPYEWEKQGVNHYHLIMSDFGGDAPPDMVLATILEMQKTLDNNHSVFISCKAGKGRSALTVLTLLTLRGDGHQLQPSRTVDNALDFLKTKRKIGINAKQLQKAKEIVEHYYNCVQSLPHDDKKLSYGVNVEDIKNFLCRIETKNAIRHFSSFKELAIYASKNLKLWFGTCKRSLHVQHLFNAIFASEDGEWYRDMMLAKGPLAEFINARPYPENKQDQAYRLELATRFKTEVTTMIANALSWTEKEVIHLIEHSPPERRYPSPT